MAAKKKAKKKVSKKKSKKKVAKKKVKKIGIKLGNDITTFLKLRKKISKANKSLEALKSEAFELTNKIIPQLDKIGLEGSDVKMGSVIISELNVFSVKNWGKVYKHILKTKDFGILSKALGQALLREYFEDGIKIKGITKSVKRSLNYGHKRNG